MSNGTCLTDSNEKCGILGVSQVLAQINHSSVIIHGPKGCVFPVFEASIADPINYNFTELCERTTVFGGDDAVKNKIEDEYYKNNPSLIALVQSCSAEITGDDVEGVMRKLELPIPLFKIDGAGFINTLLAGINAALKKVVEEVSEPRHNHSGSDIVNLICHVGSYRFWQSDVRYLLGLLEEAGIKVRPLFLHTAVETLKNCYDARLNILVLEDYGIDLARHMKDAGHLPYVHSVAPIGLEGTSRWLEAVGTALGRDFSMLIDRKISEVKNRFEAGMGRVDDFRPFETLRRMRILIIGNAAVILGFASIFQNEMGITPDLVVCKDPAEKSSEICRQVPCKNQVVFSNDFSTIKALIRSFRPTILLGNDLEYYFARSVSDPVYLNISYPGSREINFFNTPYLGFDGTLNFLQELYNKIINRNQPNSTGDSYADFRKAPQQG